MKRRVTGWVGISMRGTCVFLASSQRTPAKAPCTDSFAAYGRNGIINSSTFFKWAEKGILLPRPEPVSVSYAQVVRVVRTVILAIHVILRQITSVGTNHTPRSPYTDTQAGKTLQQKQQGQYNCSTANSQHAPSCP